MGLGFCFGLGSGSWHVGERTKMQMGDFNFYGQ